jgi:hypothetical protein
MSLLFWKRFLNSSPGPFSFQKRRGGRLQVPLYFLKKRGGFSHRDPFGKGVSSLYKTDITFENKYN